MEEKKSVKISLKTYLVSMFIMLLVIGMLLGYIMHTSKTIQAKLTTIAEHIESQSNVEENNEIEETEDKEETEDNSNEENVIVENIVAENDEKEENGNIISNEVVEEITFSEEEIENALENYLNIFKGHGSPEGILDSLDLILLSSAEKYELTEDNFKKTDIPYSVFEEKIQQYTTLENFETINKGGSFVELEFKEIDDKVAYFDGGWSGIEYEVYKIEAKEDSLPITHTAEILRTEGDRKVIENVEFSVESNDGKCIISYCD